MKWPYENELGIKETVRYDVVVLGGGISGCLAAISAKNKGLSVAIVEKGSIGKSTDKVLYNEVIERNRYLEELLKNHGEELLIQLEKMGLKENESNLNMNDRLKSKILSKNFKPTLVRQLRILGIKLFERVEACNLLINENKVCGAIGIHTRTAKTMIFEAKSVIMAMSKPSRIFHFNSEIPALSEPCAFQCVGSGIAMAIRNGVEIEYKNKEEFGIQFNKDLKTNIDGLFVCGKQLIGCDDVLSCVSGNYVGKKASDYAMNTSYSDYDSSQIINEEKRLFAPFYNTGNMSWIECNAWIVHCIQTDITQLEQCEYVNQLSCRNPHDLVRIHEVFDILEIAKMLMKKVGVNHESN